MYIFMFLLNRMCKHSECRNLINTWTSGFNLVWNQDFKQTFPVGDQTCSLVGRKLWTNPLNRTLGVSVWITDLRSDHSISIRVEFRTLTPEVGFSSVYTVLLLTCFYPWCRGPVRSSILCWASVATQMVLGFPAEWFEKLMNWSFL